MKKDLNEVIVDIRKEVTRLNEGITIIEIVNTSIKREKYCKDHKINYTQFMKLYTHYKNEIFMYPLIVNCMKAIINLRKKTQKEFHVLYNNIERVLQEMIGEEKKKEKKSAADEIEDIIKQSKEEREKAKIDG